MQAQNKPAPFQVLVLPYRAGRDGLRYAILRRKANTGGYWQFIAGGGHVGESRAQAARREAFEEAGVPPRSRFIRLDAFAMLPVEHVSIDDCGFHVAVRRESKTFRGKPQLMLIGLPLSFRHR